MRDFQLKYGPWALVAGASEGLGAAYAEALAKRGLNIVLCARRLDKLEELAEFIKKSYPVQTQCIQLDLSELEKTRQVIGDLDQEIGLMVYNAAFAPIALFKNQDSLAIQKTVDVNAKAPLLLIDMLGKKMIERKRGGIILMSSLAGLQGSPKIATYAATKAFNVVLAEGLWSEFKPLGVDVLACIAGAVRTPGYLASQNQKDAPGTLNAEEVVEQALKALGKGPTVVPGRFNRFANFLMSRLMPRKTAISIMNANTKELT